jgi:hypothetical protein
MSKRQGNFRFAQLNQRGHRARSVRPDRNPNLRISERRAALFNALAGSTVELGSEPPCHPG